MKIHPTAIIQSADKLGEGVEIGPYVFIDRDVEIGAGCVIGPHATIYKNTTIGAQTRIHAGAIIGDTPQDLAFKGVVSFVRIGKNCVLREHVTVHRGTKEGTSTVIGDDCYLMANSHLAHNVQLGNKVILANGVLLAGYVEVGDGAFIAGNAAIHQFCRVGRLAMVGGLSGASKDIPPFCMSRSVSYNQMAGLNVVGMRRAGFSAEDRLNVKKAFNLLYRSKLSLGRAIERIREEMMDPLAMEICDFVMTAKRGICDLKRTDDTTETE